MRQVETDQEFLHAEAPVDHIDLKRSLAQYTVAVLELFRRNDLHRVAFFAEVLAEQFELALARVIGGTEFHNGNIRFLRAAELLIGLQNRLEQEFPAADARQVVLLAELFDGRNVVEQVSQGIGITSAGGRIGVVLHEPQGTVREMGIEPRCDLQGLVAGVDRSQHLFRGEQFEARQQGRVREHQPLHPVDGADQCLAGFDQRFVLSPRDEIRPQEGANQAPAGGKLCAFHSLVERFGPLEIAERAIFQKPVIPGNCVVQLGHSDSETYSRIEYPTLLPETIDLPDCNLVQVFRR